MRGGEFSAGPRCPEEGVRMKNIIVATLLLLGLIAVPLTAVGKLPSDFDTETEIKKLNAVLASAPTAADSMKILSDLFDLHRRAKKDSVGHMLFEASLRAGDASCGLDALRNLGNLHVKSDSLLEADMANAMLFAPSDDRDETLAFLRILHNSAKAMYSSEIEKEQDFHQAMKRLNADQNLDIYDRIVLLHAVCVYIGKNSQGDLLSKYIGKLGEMIEHLRPEAYALRNCYYVQAALAYANNMEYDKSVEIDRKLLAIIDSLEKGEIGRNRRYRSYDSNRYVVYTRLLSNYPSLSDAEIEEYYTKAMDIVEHDYAAGRTFAASGTPQIYYAMYKHDYPQVLALLDKYLNAPYNASKRERLLKYGIEAAEATGNRDVLLSYSREYNKVLEEILSRRLREKYKELQMVYDVHELKRIHLEESKAFEHTALIWAIVAAGVLFVLLIVLALMLRHMKVMAASLRSSNEALATESQNLRRSREELVKARDEARKASMVKTMFIRNFSSEITVPLRTINEYTNLIIDCSEAGYKPYLKHFADLVALNSEVLTTILSDVLNLSEIDSDTMVVNNSPQRLEPILEAAVTSMQRHMKEGVKLELKKQDEKVSVNADPNRLLQIMVQLISNAAKATTDGAVTVSYDVNREAGEVNVSVTDTGIGIPEGNNERIFERFVKLDRTAPGVGVGLTVARHLARLLGGDLSLDTTYTAGGARFVLTLPLAGV